MAPVRPKGAPTGGKVPPFEMASLGPGIALASGASARVWLARGRPGAGARWAIKVPHAHLLADASFRATWHDEVTLGGEVRHAHLVAACAYDPATEALALSYVEGVSLAALLELGRARGGGLPPGFVARAALDVLDALDALHGGGAAGRPLVHGDVGPRNVLVDVAGRALLCDFGAAGPPAERASFRGSVAYASPEAIARGERSPALDVYGVGVLTWEALRGERLFRGASEAQTLLRAASGGAPPVDEGRPELAPAAGWVAAALRPDPPERPGAARARAELGTWGPAWPRARVGALVRAWAADELARRRLVERP
jgi:serine/threonine-protein kinase